jgi:hypothetical protein
MIAVVSLEYAWQSINVNGHVEVADEVDVEGRAAGQVAVPSIPPPVHHTAHHPTHLFPACSHLVP